MKQPACRCGKKAFRSERDASIRFEKIQRLNLPGEQPTGVTRCHDGLWHLKFPTSDTGPSPKVRAQVEARDGNRCVKCGQPVARDEDSIHHRWPRGRGGTNDVENLILLCGTGTTRHHGWVEKNRAVSYKLGYLVETGIDPADVPVLVAGKGWMYATADGRWITPEEYGQDPAELPCDPITEALTDPFVRYAVPPAHP
jgi:5-methylcytosine-specific restriction endonuclease McrA